MIYLLSDQYWLIALNLCFVLFSFALSLTDTLHTVNPAVLFQYNLGNQIEYVLKLRISPLSYQSPFLRRLKIHTPAAVLSAM